MHAIKVVKVHLITRIITDQLINENLTLTFANFSSFSHRPAHLYAHIIEDLLEPLPVSEIHQEVPIIGDLA